MKDKENPCVITLTTCSDLADARLLATKLLEMKLAACINIIPGILSLFEWKGVLEEAQEHLLIIKSLASRQIELHAGIKAEHPYECPEIVTLSVDRTSETYLSWLTDTLL